MKLVVITDSKKNDNELAAVVMMFEAGLETLHIRKSRFSTKELSDYIQEIPSHFHNRIIIHSHHRLALKYNLKGIHFTSSHLKQKFKLWWNTKLIYIRRPKLVKSISFNRATDVYLSQKVVTHYCFLGTIFHNISGEFYNGFYKESLQAAIKKSGKRIYARGGISEKSIELANDLGFYGVALHGYLWKSTSPYTKYIEFINYCKDKNIPIE